MKLINKSNLILVYIVVLFLVDILNKKTLDLSDETLLLIKMTKTIFYIIFVALLVKDKDYRFIKPLGILLFLFLINQAFLIIRNPNLGISNVVPNIRELLLYCFPFIFSYILYSQEDKVFVKRLTVLFEIIIWIVLSTTILGFLFNIDLFLTYNQNRFGFMGLMPKSITATYFYIGALIYAYYSMMRFNKLKILFFLLLLGSILVGTKGIYLLLFLLAAFHFINQKWYFNKTFYIVGTITIAALILFREKCINFIKSTFYILYDLYQREGLLTALTSMRSRNLITNSNKYEPFWEWYNFLIGGRISLFSLFEMSIVDLTVFFGIFGAIYYLINIYKLTVAVRSQKSSFFLFSIFSLFFVSIFAGQFFINISAITYIIIVFFLLNKMIDTPNNNEVRTN